MNRTQNRLSLLASLMLASAAFASDAETSATAGTRGGRDGTAGATASYEGDLGFARTDSRSGAVNTARGVAVGVDENGLSLSVSHALAPRFGPALASSFNMSIGLDGQVSSSVGTAVASGSPERSVTAGGSTSTGSRIGPFRTEGSSASVASGRTGPTGSVRAVTRADHYRGQPVLQPTGRVVKRVVRPAARPIAVRRVVGRSFRSR